MASLTFESIGKTYTDGTVAVANVSFTIADGEFVVLVGPSGCGKSTLLRMAAGLEALNGGRLMMDGRDGGRLTMAGFIGSPAMNFMRVDLSRNGDRLTASVAGTAQRIAVPATPALSALAGGQAIVGIRPEGFEVCRPEEAVFHEPVAVAEALGADTFVFFDIASPPVDMAALGENASLTARSKNRLVARIPPSRAPRPNERLPLTATVEALHWFDPATGRAVRD